ncbi:MAG: hypothetical protein ACM3XO_22105 [Bacteroidota bacterium]
MVYRTLSIVTAFLNGAVWLGKPKRRIPRRWVETLNDQVIRGIPTHVIIFNTKGNHRLAYGADLLDVSLKTPKEKELIPRFYTHSKLLSRMRTWVKLGYPVDAFGIDEYPSLEKACLEYVEVEQEYSKRGPVSMPGYIIMH